MCTICGVLQFDAVYLQMNCDFDDSMILFFGISKTINRWIFVHSDCPSRFSFCFISFTFCFGFWCGVGIEHVLVILSPFPHPMYCLPPFHAVFPLQSILIFVIPLRHHLLYLIFLCDTNPVPKRINFQFLFEFEWFNSSESNHPPPPHLQSRNVRMP